MVETWELPRSFRFHFVLLTTVYQYQGQQPTRVSRSVTITATLGYHSAQGWKLLFHIYPLFLCIGSFTVLRVCSVKLNKLSNREKDFRVSLSTLMLSKYGIFQSEGLLTIKKFTSWYKSCSILASSSWTVVLILTNSSLSGSLVHASSLRTCSYS